MTDVTILPPLRTKEAAAEVAELLKRLCDTSPDGAAAARIIEEMQDRIERLSMYVQHDETCRANDFDYLDKTECTCGLQSVCNPKGQRITN